jgi:2-deoxy-D-gluconate 3-dehydrogenase
MSFQGGINVPAYAATKHALSGLTKSLSNNWSSKGINVNNLNPGASLGCLAW